MMLKVYNMQQALCFHIGIDYRLHTPMKVKNEIFAIEWTVEKIKLNQPDEMNLYMKMFITIIIDITTLITFSRQVVC